MNFEMKRWIVSILMVFSLSAYAEVNPDSITIGFLPGGDATHLKAGAVAIAQALQDQLNIPVNVYLSKNYSGLVVALKTKKVDFAFLTAMSYVASEKEVATKVLLKKVWEEPFYYSVIMTKKNSSLKKIEDLKGKRFGFVDEKSTSGYLYPQVVFKKKNIGPFVGAQAKITGSHANSVEALDKGEVDAIAVFSDSADGKKNAYLKYSQVKNPQDHFRILWVSDPIPNEPFCVRQQFYDQYPKATHNLMFALIDVVEKLKDNKQVRDLLGSGGFAPATQKQYDPVREMVKELGLTI